MKSASVSTPFRRTNGLAICIALLAVFAATAWLASLHESATTDEPASLLSAWACTHLHDFRCDQENPPLWKYYVQLGAGGMNVPLDSPRWREMVGNTDVVGPFALDVLYRTPGNDADALLRPARARMLFLAVILAAMVAWWAWRIGGPLAGVVAAAFFCFDPNFLAHAPLVKNDLAVALTIFWLAAIVWLLGQRGTWLRLLLLPLALASVLMVKFSGLIAIPMLAAALLIRALLAADWPIAQWNIPTRARRLAAAGVIFIATLAVSWGLIWACYDFRYLPTPDPSESCDFARSLQLCASHEFIADSDDPFNVPPQAVQDFVRHWTPPVSVRLVLAANAHRLLPQSCLWGLLNTYAWTRGRMAYLCGSFSLVGWWYYFPVAMALKTPLATLAALALAPWVLISRKRSYWTLIAAALPPAMYMAFAMTGRVDVGIRHIFPVYPFLFVLLGVAASAAIRRFKIPAVVIVAGLIAGLAVETYWAFPNYIPFFNVASRREKNSLPLLGDSNVDWGQGLPQLASWARENPHRQIYLCYWGSADPRYYKIRYVNLPGSNAPADQTEPTGEPAVYVISEMALCNPGFRQQNRMLLQQLESRGVITKIDGSLYVFDAR